jgi:hypothetical protein
MRQTAASKTNVKLPVFATSFIAGRLGMKFVYPPGRRLWFFSSEAMTLIRRTELINSNGVLS